MLLNAYRYLHSVLYRIPRNCLIVASPLPTSTQSHSFQTHTISSQEVCISSMVPCLHTPSVGDVIALTFVSLCNLLVHTPVRKLPARSHMCTQMWVATFCTLCCCYTSWSGSSSQFLMGRLLCLT